MAIVISGLLILWGGFVLYSALFRMKKQDYNFDVPVVKGVSGLLEFEFLFKVLSKTFPLGVIKGITIFIGILLVAFGMVLLFI